ncbi:MAG TPA: hypothetical protein VGR08_13815 [Thermomicrobiales bacterium]|nr:hypothetical protein [Thermomicrobiales bacterium]
MDGLPIDALIAVMLSVSDGPLLLDCSTIAYEASPGDGPHRTVVAPLLRNGL